MMRKILLTVVLGFSAIFSSSITAQAQNTPAAKVIVVDFARVTRESLAGLDIGNQIKANNVKVQARAKELQDGLRADQENLAKQQALLTPEEQQNIPDSFQQLVREFQLKQQSAERELQEKQQGRQAAVEQANAEMENALRPIVRQLMTERGANLALDKNVVFDQLDGLDVTTQVIERLNQRMPSLKMALPE